MTAFVAAFRSEWLKRKRSFATSLVIAGSMFTPAVIVAVRLTHSRGLPAIYASGSFWPNLWRAAWESMAVFFLPLVAIMATSLIVQIEFRSNAWKHVRTLPMSPALLFLAKLSVIVVLLVQFLMLFTAGVYISGMTPAIVLPAVAMPQGSFLALPFLRENAIYLVECLPVIAFQYLIALRTPNAFVPIGIGFVAWVGALAAVSSKLAAWWPYAYTTLHYLKASPKAARAAVASPSPWICVALFVVISIINYSMFVARTEKG